MRRFLAFAVWLALAVGPLGLTLTLASPALAQSASATDRLMREMLEFSRRQQAMIHEAGALSAVAAEGGNAAIELAARHAGEAEISRWYADWSHRLDNQIAVVQQLASDPPRFTPALVQALPPGSPIRRYGERAPALLTAITSKSIEMARRIRDEAPAAARGDESAIRAVSIHLIDGVIGGMEAEVTTVEAALVMAADDHPQHALGRAMVACNQAVIEVLHITQARLQDPDADISGYLRAARAAAAEVRAAATALPGLAQKFSDDFESGRLMSRSDPAYALFSAQMPAVTATYRENAAVELRIAALLDRVLDKIEQGADPDEVGGLVQELTPLGRERMEIQQRRINLFR